MVIQVRVLMAPDFDKPSKLVIDVKVYGNSVCGVLRQKDEEGIGRSLGFYFTKVNKYF